MKKIADKYEILPKKDVTLAIKFGEGQIGVCLVKFENKVLEEDSEKKEYVIPSDKLSGKSLYILAVITDVNPNSDRTSILYSLKGGKEDYNAAPVKGEIEEEGGVTFCQIVITFYIGQ